MSRVPRAGAESDGRWKCLEAVGRDLPEYGQDELDAEGQAEGGERRLATLKAFGHQTDERDEGRTHCVEAPSGPTDGAGQQHVVPADEMSCGLDRSGLLDLIDDMLDVLQRAGQSRGEAVGKQAESLLSCWAIPARNACARQVESRVRADVVKAATTPRMSGTSIKSCRLPLLSVNVFLAGEAKFPSELHRPRPARVDAVAGHLPLSLVTRSYHRGSPMREIIGRYAVGLRDRETVSPASQRDLHRAVNHEGIRAATLATVASVAAMNVSRTHSNISFQTRSGRLSLRWVTHWVASLLSRGARRVWRWCHRCRRV